MARRSVAEARTSAGGSATGAAGGNQAVGGTGGAPEVVGGCDHQLLANADFERGPTPEWTQTSDWPGIDIIVAGTDATLAVEGVTPYAGNYLAWLGGIPDNPWDHHLVVLEQTVAIPANAATLTLTGRYWVTSLDDPSAEYDEAYLEFSLDDEVVWQAERFTNQSVTSAWASFSSTTTEPELMAGKAVTFVAYSRTDLEGVTSFFLDSLRLEASCGR